MTDGMEKVKESEMNVKEVELELKESEAKVKEAEAKVEEQEELVKQQVSDEQDRQQRVADCTLAVQKGLKEYNCDLDVSVVLRAGQVIPRIAIVPVEVLQAQQRTSQSQSV